MEREMTYTLVHKLTDWYMSIWCSTTANTTVNIHYKGGGGVIVILTRCPGETNLKGERGGGD